MKNLLGAVGSESFQFGWFDGVVVILLIIGFFRGRKHGMSQEILLVLQWLLIVVIGSQYYEPLGKVVYDLGIVGPLWSYWIVYVGIAIVLKIVFTNIKRFVGEKIFASDVFGRWEFYLGMIAGVLRYCCWIIFGLSLINARAFTTQEIIDSEKQQTKELGSTFFPSIAKIQQQILKESFTGIFIRKEFNSMLIKPTSPKEGAQTISHGPAKKRESAVDEAITGKPEKK